MNPDLEKLIALQAADREIERLHEEIAALPRRVAAIENKLATTRTLVEKAKAALGRNQAERRKLEGEIQGHQQKISKYREQSLEVKTNEQYKALLQEIEFAEKEIRACEDRILEGMIDSESQELALKAAEAELKEETAEVEKEKVEARARTAEDQKQLAEWGSRRDELRAGISAEALRYYDRVVRLRKNALAEARQQKCLACNVLLRPQTYNDVRTNEQVIACDSCGRILYYDPTHEPDAALEPTRVSKRGETTVERAWYYSPDSNYGPVFLAMVNAKGSCSKRVFDAGSGRALDKQIRQDSEFTVAFAGDIRQAKRVFVEQQPNLEEDCSEQLPPDLLFELRRQVEAHESSAAETPAAK